jgi:L-ascorbate metabolism protein UlaG (beta-lactamase superfamily)
MLNLEIIFTILNIIKYLVYILLALAIVVYIFLTVTPVFGGTPDKDTQKTIEDSQNFVEGKFRNIKTNYINFRASEKKATFKDWFSPPKDKNPLKPLPTIKFNGRDLTEGKFVWLGHSTVLMKTEGLVVMTDPVFNRASPLPSFSSKSKSSFFNGKPFVFENPILLEDLPKVDIVIISHDHYDHLDSKAIKDLSNLVDHFIVPLGVGAHLERWGVDKNKITELDWYESKSYKDIEFIFAPALHFSGRGITKGNSTLWGSWIVKSKSLSAYFSGDGGYSETFKKLGNEYGPFDIAFIENGAYNIDWSNVHMFPDESVQASIDLKAKVLLPIHWSKFDLSIHPWDEPIIRATQEAKKKNVKIATPMFGEVFDLNNLPRNPWWEKLRN